MAPPALWLPVLGLLVVGCGHPATREECETIFTRNAQLELAEQNITEPAEVERKIVELREARGAIVDRCVGIRITTKAVQCIEAADSKEQVEDCLQ